MEVRRVDREDAFSIMARSMMVMRGATSPDAQAAEVISVVMRQGRSSVFHFTSLEEVVAALVEGFWFIATESIKGLLRSWSQ